MARAAREIVDANSYMTLATADRDGRPWASPVWFAHEAYRDFLWVSKPEARHSANLAERPELGIAFPHPPGPPGRGAGLYFEARAERVADEALDGALASFSERSIAQGGAALGVDDVLAPGRLRMYRATVEAAYLLGDGDERVPVDLVYGVV